MVEFEAYYRRVRERFLAALADEPETYGWPCGHCGICDFRHMCWQQRVDDDHLTLVAGMRRVQAETLMDAGIPTLEALGDMPRGTLDAWLKPGTGASAESLRRRPPPGRAAAARPPRGPLPARAPPRPGGARLPPAARARRGRRLVRHGGPPVLRDLARARVPLRLLLPRRRGRGRLRGGVGERPRRRARRVRAVRRLGRRAPRAATRACTSTTTPPTSARR